MNPYETLGVPLDADAAEIQRAHRKAAKATHPDHGGDADRFAEVQKAVSILRDPQRRAKYDATGNCDDEPRDNAFAAAAGVLAAALPRAIAALGHSDPDHVDIAERIRQTLKDDLRQLAEERKKTEGERKQIEKMQKRFTYKGKGPDVLSSFFGQQIAVCNQRLAELEQSEAATKTALEMAADYDCAFEPPMSVSILAMQEEAMRQAVRDQMQWRGKIW